MGASLHIFYSIAKDSPQSCKDLVPSFVSILKQITEHRLPRDFDYHRMPAPWLQVKLLSILSCLGASDQKASEQMYEILQEVVRRADSGVNVGYAIIYECVKCITKIYPEHSLLELAASNVSRFISSDNHNLKYLGVTGLAQIVQVNPSYAAEHQMVVVDCLEDPDDTLKRKTLDLLFRMTNPQNVVVVVDKLTFHLRTSVDTHLRRELVQRITQLAERFAPNNEWYVTTMNTVFEMGGDLVPAETAYNLMRLVAEGTGDDEEANQAFRTFAVNTHLKLLEKPLLSDILVQVIAWVLGEYACLADVDGYSLQDIIDLMCDCFDRPFEDPATRGYLVTALVKLAGQNNIKSSSIDKIIRMYRSSRYTDLQQRCYEFEQLRGCPELTRRVLPHDASCEDIDVNTDLSFLDGFVRQKVAEGAKHYRSKAERDAQKNASTNGFSVGDGDSKPTLNFTPYQAPTKPSFASGPIGGSGGEADFGSSGGPSAGPGGGHEQKGLMVSGPRKWGPTGYNTPGGKPDTSSQYNTSASATSTAVSSSQQANPSYSSSTGSSYSAKAADDSKAQEMTEKQKMAAALFGGIGGGGAAATPAARPTTSSYSKPETKFEPPARTAEPAPPPPAAKPAAAAPPMDLLDLGGSSPTVATPSPPPAAAEQIDMLSLDMPASAPAPAPAAQAASAQLDDLLLGPAVTASPPPPPSAGAPAAPLLGPLQITTAQLGSMWGQLPSERRVQLNTSIGSCQILMQRLQSGLNVHPVEIIGMEGIAAGRVLPGNDPCFLHGKLQPPRLDVLVRCRDAGVAQRVADMCLQSLA
eukprot:gnl/TRDRNA2_/TRDRNA2_166944_c1_seq1.p1 gnl/TRDRNA2_/TRDRNA2_166944_c1~~gnl/TRDRNA2_/TRDRNA2_166944_c1_seq1.p1  ORF type:complete len:911 (+),score=179.30 gnl/TRDRNA2_/TRDRNA2_166944_c1_seq1:310-2733(+)